MNHNPLLFFFFFFNDTATTEIYTLSLHDALPICPSRLFRRRHDRRRDVRYPLGRGCPFHAASAFAASASPDRKSTRLNSSHLVISYAVFCLKKKKKPLTIRFLHLATDLDLRYLLS